MDKTLYNLFLPYPIPRFSDTWAKNGGEKVTIVGDQANRLTTLIKSANELDREKAMAEIAETLPAWSKLVHTVATKVAVGSDAPNALAWFMARNRMWTESRFKNWLVSQTGARGVGQVLPSTAADTLSRYSKWGLLPFKGVSTVEDTQNALGVSLATMDSFVQQACRLGVPSHIAAEVSGCPKPIQILISAMYYYHNGGKIPCPDNPAVVKKVKFWRTPPGNTPAYISFFKRLLKEEAIGFAKAWKSVGENKPPVLNDALWGPVFALFRNYSKSK